MLFSDFNKSQSGVFDDALRLGRDDGARGRRDSRDYRDYRDYRNVSRVSRAGDEYLDDKYQDDAVLPTKANVKLVSNIIGSTYVADGSGENLEGSDKLKEVMLRVTELCPYLSALLCTLAVVQDEGIRKIAVDNDTFSYNPDYLIDTSVDRCAKDIISAMSSVANLGTKGNGIIVIDCDEYI